MINLQKYKNRYYVKGIVSIVCSNKYENYVVPTAKTEIIIINNNVFLYYRVTV